LVYIQDGNAVVGKVLNLLVPAGSLEVTVAPRVVVESEEIRSLVVAATVHVHRRLHAVRGNVGSRVSDRDRTQSSRVHVVLHITSDSFDVGSGRIGSRLVVDDLVTRKEGQCVVILGKHLNGSKNALKVHGVVGRPRFRAVDGVARVVDIKDQIDASIGESAHALVMVLRIVDGIDTNGVDSKVLEVFDISGANIGISQGILVG
jgi:hypothetical protein